jgi:hypothetical protein
MPRDPALQQRHGGMESAGGVRWEGLAGEALGGREAGRAAWRAGRSLHGLSPRQTLRLNGHPPQRRCCICSGRRPGCHRRRPWQARGPRERAKGRQRPNESAGTRRGGARRDSISGGGVGRRGGAWKRARTRAAGAAAAAPGAHAAGRCSGSAVACAPLPRHNARCLPTTALPAPSRGKEPRQAPASRQAAPVRLALLRPPASWQGAHTPWHWRGQRAPAGLGLRQGAAACLPPQAGRLAAFVPHSSPGPDPPLNLCRNHGGRRAARAPKLRRDRRRSCRRLRRKHRGRVGRRRQHPRLPRRPGPAELGQQQPQAQRPRACIAAGARGEQLRCGRGRAAGVWDWRQSACPAAAGQARAPQPAQAARPMRSTAPLPASPPGRRPRRRQPRQSAPPRARSRARIRRPLPRRGP